MSRSADLVFMHNYNLSKYFIILLFVLPIKNVLAQTRVLSERTAVPGEFIVRYKPGAASTSSLAKTAVSLNLKLKANWTSVSTYHFKTNTINSDDQILEELKSDPNVLIAEPNYLVKALDLPYTPTSDTIKAPESWEISSDYTRSPNSSPGSVTQQPIVAVIDTGLDTSHEIFRDTGRLWVNEVEANGFAGVDDDGNGLIDDINGWNFVDNNNNINDTSPKGHGTHIAGVVVASTEPLLDVNQQTYSRIKVMPLKFLDASGVGKTSDAINAIYYAVNNGAKVLNNSWGGTGFSSALLEAITYSYNNNTVFVAAAGNESSNNDITPIYPASYDVPNLISVGASAQTRSATFTNFGSESVHIFAPGVNIYSTLPNNDYGFLNGTSMAAPFVSGLAALMSKEAPSHSGFQIKRDMLEAADSFYAMNGQNLSDGRVNFESSVLLSQLNKDEENYLPSYTPDFTSRGLASLADNGSLGAGCGRVKALYKEKNASHLNKNKVNNGISFIIILLPLALLGLLRRKLEKRKFQRIKTKYLGSLTVAQNKYKVLVKDLSLGGAGIEVVEADGAANQYQSIEDFLAKNQGVKGELEVHFEDKKASKKFSCQTTFAKKRFIGLAFD